MNGTVQHTHADVPLTNYSLTCPCRFSEYLARTVFWYIETTPSPRQSA